MSQLLDQKYQIHLEPGFAENKGETFLVQLQEILESSPADIWLDCSSQVRVTSQCVGVLWHAYQCCASAGARLNLLSVTDGLFRTLQVLDLCDVFGLEPTEVEHRSGLPQESASIRELHTDRFRATEEEVDEALIRLGQFLRRLDLNQTLVLDLQTLFYEAVTNIRCHAELDPDEEISVTLTIDQSEATFSFRDPGVSFDPTRHPVDFDFAQAARSGQNHGFGLALMRRMADQMTHSREHGTHNLLTVTKKRGV